MSDYKQPYIYLFNKLSDLSDEIKTIQTQAEELFISGSKATDNNQPPEVDTKEN